jgi:hypothetical protein
MLIIFLICKAYNKIKHIEKEVMMSKLKNKGYKMRNNKMNMY